jgi:hypothetical protein
MLPPKAPTVPAGTAACGVSSDPGNDTIRRAARFPGRTATQAASTIIQALGRS